MIIEARIFVQTLLFLTRRRRTDPSDVRVNRVNWFVAIES